MQKQLPTPYSKPRQKREKQPEQEPQVSNLGEEYMPKSIEDKLASISAQLSTIMETQAAHSAWFTQIQAQMLAEFGLVPDTHAEQMARQEMYYAERESIANTHRLYNEIEHRKKYLQILAENLKNYGR